MPELAVCSLDADGMMIALQAKFKDPPRTDWHFYDLRGLSGQVASGYAVDDIMPSMTY
jgi:hypothetical protein